MIPSWSTILAGGLALLALAARPTPARAQCTGDCNDDSAVAINELVTGVTIALGTAPLSHCFSFDTNGDDAVATNELVEAVNDALMGCVAGPPSGGTFELMTRHTDGTLPDSLYNSRAPDVSADGSFVVFESDQIRLVTPPTNGRYQIFLHDRLIGVTELVSANADGEPGNNASYHAAVSDDGCHVAFHSAASNLVPEDGNGLNDVFVRERCVSPNVTARVSVDENGSPLLRESTDPDISSDGRFVAFDNNGVIRRYDRDLGASVLVAEGNFAARVPAISADGGRIAFWSFASDLVDGDTNGMWDIFVWEADGASVTLVSTTGSGEQQVQGNEGVSTIAAPGISGDGRFVAFRSRTTNLLPGETGGFSHVYVKNTATGAIERASRSSSGELGNGDSSGSGSGLRPSLSFDGKWIAFTTRASNLAPETGGMVPNIVAHNRLTGTTVGFTTATGDDPPSISGDLYGRFVAMFSTGKLDPQFPSSGVFLHDRHTPPVANAGRPQTVTAGSVVMLNGRRSFLSPNPYLAPTEPSLQYLWSQLEGPTAVSFVPGPTVATPSFTATAAGIYRFQLVVSDTVATSAPSTVTISVVR